MPSGATSTILRNCDGIVGGHLGCDPSAERKSDDIDGRELLLLQIARIEAGHIADVH